MTYDAVIVGAGPAGATAARLLARAGWKIALIEKKTFPRRKVCGEFISATSLPLLADRDIRDAFFTQAGPEIRRLAVFAGSRAVTADMPRAANDIAQWGRALGRETLDTALRDAGVRAGAALYQPCDVTAIGGQPGGYSCDITDQTGTRQIATRLVVIANGSWERSPLSEPAQAHAASDLFAFKAHFANSDLAGDLMPLIAFPGGYGGLVHTDKGRVSLSCCIRRDVLERCRDTGGRAGDAVLRHIVGHNEGVAGALGRAELCGAWLSSGPIRPGIRWFQREGVFACGNAAAEAHPIIAEGISMAMQGAALLCERLIAAADATLSGAQCDDVGRGYAAAWKRRFALRLRASAALAQLAMRPLTAAAMARLVAAVPPLLTWGARISGKTADHRRGDTLSTPNQRAMR